MAKTIKKEKRKTKKKKNDFEKDFFKVDEYAVFGKTVENVRKYRHIKLVTTEGRRNYVVSEPNYRTTKFFTEHLLAIEMKKETYLFMNRPASWRLSILGLRKILMYEFWYDDIYKYIAENVETRFDTSNYKLSSRQILVPRTSRGRPPPTSQGRP